MSEAAEDESASGAGRRHDGDPRARTGPDGSVVAVAILAATVSLLGATGPVRAGADDPVSVALAGLAALALGCVLGVRYGAVSSAFAGAIAATASVLVGVLSVYGLNHDTRYEFGIPPIDASPTLLVGLIGAGLTVGATVALATGITGPGLRRRFVATVRYSLVGVLGYVAIVVWIVVLVAAVVPPVTGAPATELTVTEEAVFSQAATVLGVGSVAVGFLVWTERGPSFIDLSVPTLRDLGYIVGGLLAIVGAAIAINALLGATGTEGADHGSFERAAGAPELLLVLTVASVLVIGPFEELLYRNVIQKSLYAYFSRAGAVVVASVPFAIVHAAAYAGGDLGQSIVSLGVVLALSLLLGTLYARTENLVVPALVHGLYNAFVYYTTYVSMTA